jgi:hypothetical protein
VITTASQSHSEGDCINPDVVEEWEQQRNALRAEVAGLAEVCCHIPGWEPVDLDVRLRWLQSSIFEGFYVTYRVSTAGERGDVFQAVGIR